MAAQYITVGILSTEKCLSMETLMSKLPPNHPQCHKEASDLTNDVWNFQHIVVHPIFAYTLRF